MLWLPELRPRFWFAQLKALVEWNSIAPGRKARSRRDLLMSGGGRGMVRLVGFGEGW